jgi:hypothetical protein
MVPFQLSTLVVVNGPKFTPPLIEKMKVNLSET